MFTRWRLHWMWWRTSNCSSLHIYRPREDERLSWPGWLTYSGRFTHISGHPSAAGRAQDGKRTLARDWHSTAEPRGPTMSIYTDQTHIIYTFLPKFYFKLCLNITGFALVSPTARLTDGQTQLVVTLKITVLCICIWFVKQPLTAALSGMNNEQTTSVSLSSLSLTV